MQRVHKHDSAVCATRCKAVSPAVFPTPFHQLRVPSSNPIAASSRTRQHQRRRGQRSRAYLPNQRPRRMQLFTRSELLRVGLLLSLRGARCLCSFAVVLRINNLHRKHCWRKVRLEQRIKHRIDVLVREPFKNRAPIARRRLHLPSYALQRVGFRCVQRKRHATSQVLSNRVHAEPDASEQPRRTAHHITAAHANLAERRHTQLHKPRPAREAFERGLHRRRHREPRPINRRHGAEKKPKVDVKQCPLITNQYIVPVAVPRADNIRADVASRG
mmetsp:Transcript_3816/g.8400  ORF Transcript_3816/g.8400 Transcript_3816/m.8400 type:complete len:273 (+) Transcript_3816:655-1473(+)